jgi:regulation of enolase protein 1 (concanavalin A-like superfamily)
MARIPRSTLVLVIMASWVFPALSQSPPPQTLKGWGVAVDPKGDCRIGLDGEKLKIEVPGTKHDLSAEASDMNAPRVLRDIEGDFIVQLKVSGNVQHAGDRTSDRYAAYHGAGVLLWQDDRNYIRFERAAVAQENGQAFHYANFELRKDGERASGNHAQIPDQDTFLRLERRGGKVLAAVSQDGVRWESLEPIAVEFPGRIRLGVDAINTSTEPFKAEFSEWEVYKKETR